MTALPYLTDLLAHQKDLRGSRKGAHIDTHRVRYALGASCQATAAETLKKRLFLLSELIRRDLTARFAGSVGGPVWALLNPLILGLIYGFVFSVILKTTPPVGFPGGYPEFLLAGLLPWIGFQEALMRGTGSIIEHAHLVKKLSFPPILLVFSSLGSALLLQAAGLALLGGYALVRGIGVPRPGILLLAFGLEGILLLGPVLCLAAFNVYLRDLPQLLGPVMMVLFYLTPILYPEALVPGSYGWILDLNPVRDMIALFRTGLFGTAPPPASRLAVSALASFVLAFVGSRIFRHCQQSFSDLL